MNVLRVFLLAWLIVATALPPALASDEPLRIAVASNFRRTADELVRAFKAEQDVAVTVSAGSTGKLYAQIVNGAPFDVFLAADAARPALLEESGRSVPGSRNTYAIGQLVLWSRFDGVSSIGCRTAIDAASAGRIAMANPDIAPYGAAARESLVSLGAWDDVQPRVVLGENVSQALHFAASGNATFGFVAAAQLLVETLPPTTCLWKVPPELYTPIRQQAVLLERAAGKTAARAFLSFLSGESARSIIRRDGYLLEDPA